MTEEKVRTLNPRLSRRAFLRAAALSGAGLVVASAVGACAPATPEATKEAVEPEATKVPTPKPPTATPKPPEPVSVTLWGPWGNDRFVAFQEEFNEANPLIEVVNEHLGSGSIEEKMTAAVAANAFPDMSWEYTPQLHKIDVIIPLTPYLEASDTLNEDSVFASLWPPFVWEGKIYAVPIENNTMLVWYDKDILAEVGVDEPEFGWKWDDFLAKATALTKVEDGVTVRYGTELPLFGAYTLLFFSSYLYQAGATILNEDQTKVVFDSPEGIEAITWWTDLMIEHEVAPTERLQPQGVTTGNAAMDMVHTGLWGNWIGNLDLPLGAIHMPGHKVQAAMNWASGIQIFKTAPEVQDACWEFLSWFFGPEAHMRWSLESGYVPMRKDVVEAPAYKDWLDTKAPQIRAGLESISAMGFSRPMAQLPKWSKICLLFKEEYDKVILGEATVEQALHAAADKINGDAEIFEV